VVPNLKSLSQALPARHLSFPFVGIILPMRTVHVLALICSFAIVKTADAQAVLTFGGNAQHTGIYQPVAQDLNRIRWATPIDLDISGFAHYGAPLITAANTVIVPVKTSSSEFQINTFNGSDGTAMYSLSTSYILPSYQWIPVYQPVLATGSFGTRLYYPGPGGTVYFIDNPDSSSHSVPVQRVFYTSLADYLANASAFNSTVFINTPITADAGGTIFFGFRVQGTAPAPLNTTQSGFARIDPDGNALYVLAGTAAADPNIAFDSHNSAPALSNDGTTVYVPVKSATDEFYGYLLGLDATTLSTKYRVFLKDPRDHLNNAGILDLSTASPTVAPDGDVYFGIYVNGNGSRGFLLRFSGDLAVEKTPGGFGWDYTPAIVPASMVPLYTGSSTYLIFSKYNNYATGDGDGVNRIALLDPNATQIDPHPSANGLVEMREVLTAIGPKPESEDSSFPYAVREWCINTAAVNPATNSVFAPSEDGHLYRWNLATNSLEQAAVLTSGIGEPYVPTVIGPDGTVYTLNGGTLFALGGLTGVRVTLASSMPDLRSVVVGQALTLTATVANISGSALIPTGIVAFQDTVYSTEGSTTTTLANITLDGTGHASYSTSGLGPGQHLITVSYSGDATFTAGSMTLVQNVHAFGSTTALTAAPNPSIPGQSVTFTATVETTPPQSYVPTGMVTFQEGASILAQVALGSSGAASFSTSSLSVGSHNITAVYASDSVSAASSGSVTQFVQTILVTVQTNPTGLQITVDGATFVAPQTFNWIPGTPHTIATSTPQGFGGTRYVFANWSDAGALSHTVAPTAPAMYTSNFATQFLLATSVAPEGSGAISVNPSSGDGYYAAGESLLISAFENPGYAFSNWSGDVSGKANPTSLIMSAPKSVTANFNAITTTGLRFVPVTPCRVADTRSPDSPFGGPVLTAGSTRSFTIPSSSCSIPSTALAYSLNITVVPATGTLGYLTIWPAGQVQPTVSTLNSFDGRIKANAAIVGAGTIGAVNVFVSNDTDVILDINGYFAAPETAPDGFVFYPLPPCRVMDTRQPTGPLGGPILTGGTSRTAPILSSSCGVPGTASAYSLNMTVVPTGPLDYLSAWPSGTPQPLVSTLNDFTGTVVANGAIVPAGAGGSIDVYVTQQTHLVIDINGYFAPPAAGGLLFYPMSPCRVVDTRNANGPFGGPAFSGQRDFNVAASPCGVPATTQAFSLNATVVPHASLDYLTLWPTGQPQPLVSTLNSYDASVVSNAAIVPTTAGTVSAFLSDTADLILDLNGVFGP
jgi:Bacterial Ig-like domain (group 3)/Divergent InlB B-repeat domain